jgi:hypothetical protein
VAGGSVAAASVAGDSVSAGAAVVAGAPQAERSRDVKTSRLAKAHNKDFLYISLSPFQLEYRFEIWISIFVFRLCQTS